MKTHKSKFPIRSLLTNVLTNQKSKECWFPQRSTVCRLDPSTSNASSSKQRCLWMEVGSIFRPIYTMKKHNQHYTLLFGREKKKTFIFIKFILKRSTIVFKRLYSALNNKIFVQYLKYGFKNWHLVRQTVSWDILYKKCFLRDSKSACSASQPVLQQPLYYVPVSPITIFLIHS